MINEKSNHLLNRWIYVLVKAGQDYLIPYTSKSLNRILDSGEYGDKFPPFLDRFMGSLQSDEWRPGSYYPGGLFRACMAVGDDPMRMEFTPTTLAPFYQEEFRIEADGAWRVGKKQVSGSVQSFFLKNLEFDGDIERYRVRYWLESHFETRYLHHLSPPYRIRQVTFSAGGVQLLLNDGETEGLRPASLRLDREERLYCAVKAAGLPALFDDNARWRLLHSVEEREGDWLLSVENSEIPLRLDARTTSYLIRLNH